MARNATRAIAPDLVLAIMNTAVETLCARLPAERRETIERTVYEVTAELVSTVTDPERLATMLRLRATARLTAATGELTPIRSKTQLPSPR
ncbi:MAG TPA: hypothetical protein VGP26_03225 [Actinophytocola sp.]|jgi:hypothetical protein|nr:hypothetical protein [Actinophytocola sp.]